MKVEKPKQQPTMQDITAVVLDLQEKYRNVFVHQIENEVFVYRTLGRGEYKEILTDERVTDMEKEEVICEACLLWPEEYDFQDCDAGLPTALSEIIIKNSMLDSVESRKAVLDYYRNEMFDLDNQISCIINEAFPQNDIEEIEQWDVEKTTKYLSRAEWKLHNLRGIPFNDIGEQMESFYEATNKEQVEPQQPKEHHTEELEPDEQETNTRGGSKKNKLTPEKLAELKRKYPEIDWDNDATAQEGIDALRNKDFDTESPALRPGFPYVKAPPEQE